MNRRQPKQRLLTYFATWAIVFAAGSSLGRAEAQQNGRLGT